MFIVHYFINIIISLLSDLIEIMNTKPAFSLYFLKTLPLTKLPLDWYFSWDGIWVYLSILEIRYLPLFSRPNFLHRFPLTLLFHSKVSHLLYKVHFRLFRHPLIVQVFSLKIIENLRLQYQSCYRFLQYAHNGHEPWY